MDELTLISLKDSVRAFLIRCLESGVSASSEALRLVSRITRQTALETTGWIQMEGAWSPSIPSLTDDISQLRDISSKNLIKYGCFEVGVKEVVHLFMPR